LGLVLALVVGLEFKSISRHTWNYLVVNEEPRPADVIIVLANDAGRVEEGVRLYRLGYADRILFTAVGSQTMASRAKSLGVTEDHILIEEKAWTTSGEAKYSAEVMRAQGFKSAIVVTSAYHTRRAGIIFGRFFKGWNLTIRAVPYDSSTQDNWWKDRHTATVVVFEYLKLALHYMLPQWV
jgi:uncharacterized SAM-binding protein YcdF (DUF218 family)